MTGPSDEQLKELITIRKLLILGLLRSGMSQTQIGAALGVHGTTIGRMFPTGALADPQKKPAKNRQTNGKSGIQQ